MASNRDERMKEITDRLQAGLEELFDSEKYAEYLRVMSQFHHYSFNNTLLIAMQKPDATLVAGYHAWEKKFNRHVLKGEKGIQIIAPAPVREKQEQEKIDPATGEVIIGENGQPETEEVTITIPRFKVSTVFDLSQTDGDPLPELGGEELTASVENYGIFMEAIRRVSPVPIRFDEISSGAKGYYSNTEKEIVIQSGMSELQTMKTAVHETAHAILHGRDLMQEQGIQKDQMTRETEAESVAFTVLSHFGLDTSDYSFPYIAGWSSSREMKEVRGSLDTIRRTSSEIIDGIESGMREQLLERNADRFEIYQIGDESPARDFKFMDLEYVQSHGFTLRQSDYDLIYTAPLTAEDTLDSIYEKFNLDRPADFTGHSLSVSDVVLFHRNGEDHAYFVDSFGFEEIPDFLAVEIEAVQDAVADREKETLRRDSEEVAVEGHIGTWHTLEEHEISGQKFFLMEHDEFGDTAANILVNEKRVLVAEDLWNGMDDEAMEAIKEYFDAQGIAYSPLAFPLQERYAIETEIDPQGKTLFFVLDHVTGAPLGENGNVTIYDDRSSALEEAARLNRDGRKIYYHTGEYAREHGELPLFRTSMQENGACRDGIEKVIRENFDGMHLDPGVIKPVIDRFGTERTALVLANTVKNADWDGRYSRNNKEWAASVMDKKDFGDRGGSFLINSHPAVLDGFISMFRNELRDLGFEQDGTKLTDKAFIDHFYVVDDLQKQGPLSVKDFSTLDEALGSYFALPNDKLKALGIQNSNLLPGSLDFIQCKNGIDTAVMDYTMVEVWNNPEIQSVQADIEMALALHDTETAYEIDEGFFTIQTAETGFEYSFYDRSHRLLDGGLLEDPVSGNAARSVEDAANEILKEKNITLDDCRVISYEDFMDKVELAQLGANKELSEAERLAIEIDQFSFDHDYYEYTDSYDSREEALKQLQDDFEKRHVSGVKDWLKGVAEESDDPEYVSIAQGFLDRLEKLYPDKEPSLSYCVAECMEYPVLGEYHETQTLKEATAIYEKIPADRMNGGKGIGFNLDDGSDFAGSYPLVQGGKVASEMIDLVEHYKNSPLVQQAVAEAKQYFPDARETEYQPKESHEIETAVEQKKADPSIAHSTTEIKAPEKASEPAQKASTWHQTAGKKESVLKALRERQAQIKEREKQTPAKQHDRKKGEQSL